MLLAGVALAGRGVADDQSRRKETNMEKQSNGHETHAGQNGHRPQASAGLAALNPDTLPKNPAFSQGVMATGPASTIYVGGQNAVDASGNVVGKGDLKAQTERALDNLEAVLAAGGARLEHVVKLDIHLLAGQSVQKGFEAYQPRAAAFHGRPPAVTVTFVAALGRPDWLVEIDAIAVVPAIKS
jgi:enamine deaminase RidA (YjgF/YER057c/UK114 family)